jgi:DNA-3-methyladenine glycosylase II
MPRQPTTSLLPPDPVLQAIAREVEPFPFVSTSNVFHDLMSCIIEQQIHYRSSKKVFFHVMREAGLEELTTENVERLERALPKVRLSAAKYETIAQTIEFFRQHHIDWQALDDEGVRQALSGIPGIGRWTVDMILLFTLMRPDVIPHDDYHLGRVMGALYGLPDDSKRGRKMLEIAGGWKGKRSLCVLYLLEWKERRKRKGNGAY